MKSFVRRRLRNLGLLLMVAAGLVVGLPTLALTVEVTGWTLLGSMLILTLYNARKKVPFLPLLRSSTWLQFHVYLGLLTIPLFALHAGMSWPDGVFESLLFSLYCLVSGTGVLGLLLSRLAPRRLANRGEEVLYERIPAMRHRLREQAEQVLVETAEARPSQAVADFYEKHLAVDMKSRPGPLALFQKQRARQNRAFETETRVMNDADKDAVVHLRELAEMKDNLDYHRAVQGALKYWLFVHIPLTYALLICSLYHIVLVLNFAESMHS